MAAPGQQPDPPRALIVDGRVAFVGGAGVADWWYEASSPDDPAWRDTMVRVEGPVVASLQGTFAENWLECGGEILTSPASWPPPVSAGPVEALLIRSSPSDRATTARRLSAADGVRAGVDRHPHALLLPDRALRRMFIETVGRECGCSCPAAHHQRLVRLASRRFLASCSKSVRIFIPAGHDPREGDDDRRPLGSSGRPTSTTGRSSTTTRSTASDRDVAARLRHDFEADWRRASRSPRRPGDGARCSRRRRRLVLWSASSSPSQ
jgi:cardiolipin synthase